MSQKIKRAVKSAAKKGAKTALQFSKKLSIFVSVFWALYRLCIAAAIVIQPETAEAMVTLVKGVDSVMMVNLGFYCGNSVSEKAILAWMDTKNSEGNESESGKNDAEDEGKSLG